MELLEVYGRLASKATSYVLYVPLLIANIVVLYTYTHNNTQ